MKRWLLLMTLLAMVPLTGCETKTGTAAAGGVAGAAAGAGIYEYRGRQQMDKVEQLYREGKIDQREYEIRKNQISEDFFTQ